MIWTNPPDVKSLAAALREHPNVREKLLIASAFQPAVDFSGPVPVGDDCAAIPDGDGFLLFAAEGMMEAFVERDPWFAGYCAVMVNLSDVAAMGGRPMAITDVLWTHADHPLLPEIWAGLRAASAAYAVPIVGGHTTRFPVDRTPLLAASVLGRARRLISSFDARPGDALITVTDLRGAWRGEDTLFWNASTGAPPERLRSGLEFPALLAEAGLVTAGKDISNGGIPGTLAMFLATSGAGAVLDLEAIPRPPDCGLLRWLLCFPSCGYLFSAPPDHADAILRKAGERGLTAAVVGAVTADPELVLQSGDRRELLSSVIPSLRHAAWDRSAMFPRSAHRGETAAGPPR